VAWSTGGRTIALQVHLVLIYAPLWMLCSNQPRRRLEPRLSFSSSRSLPAQPCAYKLLALSLFFPPFAKNKLSPGVVIVTASLVFLILVVRKIFVRRCCHAVKNLTKISFYGSLYAVLRGVSNTSGGIEKLWVECNLSPGELARGEVIGLYSCSYSKKITMPPNYWIRPVLSRELSTPSQLCSCRQRTRKEIR
jgi:hypothetical protein